MISRSTRGAPQFLVLLTVACAHGAPTMRGDVNIAPGTNMESLGRVAVATFWIEGKVRTTDDDGRETVTMRQHLDTMQVTENFLSPMVRTNVVMLDRRDVEARLQEVGYGSSDRITDATASSFGQELGAQTLIVGRYIFDCKGSVEPGGEGDFVQPELVFRQAVQIRVLELETGRTLADVLLYLDQVDSSGKLLPRSLAAGAAKRLIAGLQAQ